MTLNFYPAGWNRITSSGQPPRTYIVTQNPASTGRRLNIGNLHWLVLVLWLVLPASQALAQYGRAGKGRVTLYAIDFDNLAGDSRLDWLSKALKDMVLLRLEEEPLIIAKDAGEIAPFLETRKESRLDRGTSLAGDALLLMGAYRREDARLVVDLQILDMADWTSLKQETIEALYNNIPQVNQQMVEAVLAMVKGLLYASGVRLDVPPSTAVQQGLDLKTDSEKKFISPVEFASEAPAAREDLEQAIDDLAEAMDRYSGFKGGDGTTSQAGETYSREFNLEGFGALPKERARHTDLFEQVLQRVADNPYAAEIGALDLVVDPYNVNRVYLNIPITYRIKQTLLEDMLYSLPYVSTRESGGMRAIRYDKSSFNFSRDLLSRISQGDFRVIPVVQLVDATGRARVVIVDSPDMLWERYFPERGVTAVRQKRFTSMLAVTTSGYSVDVRIGTANTEVTYVVDVDVSLLTSRAEVVVRFMKPEQLERFLRSL